MGVFDEIKRFLDGTKLQGSVNTPDSYNLGTHSRNQRLLNEVLMIAPMFVETGGINFDDQNYEWVIIPNYPLPERLHEPSCTLLILPPNTYPYTPPIGFYLDREIHLAQGGKEPNAIGVGSYGAPDLLNMGWYWYCVTLKSSQGGWQTSVDYRKPDNLLTFMNMVRESLTNDF